MKISPLSQIKLEEKETSALKKYIMSCGRKKLKTETLKCKEKIGISERHSFKVMTPLIDKGSQFQGIFTKNKRKEYRGYKQCNMSKSKLINFKNDQKGEYEHKPLRSYESNMKNIVKLRRRYSYQPNYIHFGWKKDGRYSTIVDTDMRRQESSIQENHHETLKKMLKNVNRKKNQSLFGSIKYLFPEIHQETQHNRGKQSFQKYQKQKQQEEPKNQQSHGKSLDQRLKKFSLKTNRTKTTKFYNRYLNSTKKQSGINLGQQIDSEENEVSGWQNRSHYDERIKPLFFHNLSLKPYVGQEMK